MLNLLFGFKGRINRLQYWTGCVVVGVGGTLLLFMLMFMAGSSLGSLEKSSAGVAQFVATMGLILLPWSALMGWCGFAIQTKRFHDRGRSGLWCLLPYGPMMMMIITLVGAVASGASPAQVASSIQPYVTVMWIINLAMLVDLGFLPSKEGPNKYGDPPGASSLGLQPNAGAPAAPAQPSASASFLMGGAEKAMERAIAERAKPQAQAAPRPQPQPAMARQPVGMTPAPAGAPSSFGRRAPR